MDKEKLLAPRYDTASGLPEADVEIPGVGTVRVRGLSRHELLVHERERGNGTLAMESIMLSLGMVDPALTRDEARQWHKVSQAYEIGPVIDRINELSGIGPNAQREAYKSLRDGSGAGVRALPGDQAIDDRDGVAPADAG